ncbi:MAG: DUF1844 domain-containing protein [Desulfobacterales bacterium]|jgi:hypothetical protein
MSEEKKDFVIKDRRIFAEENRDQKDEAEKKETPEETPADQATAQESAETAPPEDDETEPPLPEINFSTFVFSLNASALVHLGAIEDPASKGKVKNLSMAKQTIDILSMLEEKTKGNLNKDEENIIKNILYDLRIAYVREKG